MAYPVRVRRRRPASVSPLPADTSARPPLRRVVAVVDDGVAPFEFAIPCEVFGIDRSGQGLPAFDFTVASVRPGPVRTSLGFRMETDAGLDAVTGADLVVVPPYGTEYEPGADLTAALQETVRRGGRIAGLCSASFTLARAGLLDGRAAATHWFHEDTFRARFPGIELRPDVLYVEDGPIVTSAGTAAGIDMCLHLVRQAHGADAANGIARRMVVPPHRDGGQAQFVQTPVRPPTVTTLSPVLDWARAHLDQDLSVQVLAARAAMSERTLARRFLEETGSTPHKWVQAQRVALAEQLLEQGGYTVEQVAARVGFGSTAVLRHHFGRLRRTTPTAYRRLFGAA